LDELAKDAWAVYVCKETIHTNGTERIVLSSGGRVRDGVEEGGFTDVGKTNDTNLKIVGGTTQKNLFFLDCFLWWHVSEIVELLIIAAFLLKLWD
jgi:hypothetical protein